MNEKDLEDLLRSMPLKKPTGLPLTLAAGAGGKRAVLRLLCRIVSMAESVRVGVAQARARAFDVWAMFGRAHSMRRKTVVVLAACVVTGVGVVAVLLLQAGGVGAVSGAGVPGASQPAFPRGIAERVAGQIETVSAESVVETIANLARPGMYYWPGAHDNRMVAVVFPLLKSEGGRDLEMAFSNRRFLKLCEDLSALGPQVATQLLNESIPVYLGEYKAVVDEYLRMLEGRFPPGSGGGVGFQVSGPPDGRPNPLGPRFRLLTLVLAAGNLGLAGTHSAVLEVAEEALGQRARFYREDEFGNGFRFGMLTVAGLYNRQLLGYALLKTNPDPTLAQDVLGTLGKEVVVRELPVFDAQRTPYDARYMPGPVDESKGVLTVEYLPPITDEEFDLIVAAVLAAQEEPAEGEAPE